MKTSQRHLSEHFLSIILVSLLFIGLILNLKSDNSAERQSHTERLQPFLNLDFIDYDDPLHKAMLLEALNDFYPDQAAANRQLISDIEQFRRQRLLAGADRSQKDSLNAQKLASLAGMYFSFIMVYLIVMLLTYYGVQTLATYRFVKFQQRRNSYLGLLWQHLSGDRKIDLPYLGRTLLLFAKASLKGVLYFILFSPAYVIAYSFKTRFDTDTVFFMVLLGVISNGLLITYAQKFYTFLMAENRRGYVDTARVKNLNSSYRHSGGITLRQILAIRKSFPGHIFQHIYMNARHQYINTIKEQASFLITGLVIIEMALNVQGHLCYELLQNLLFKQFDVALTIILGIFLVIKATDIFTDLWQNREQRRYAN